MRVSLNEIEKRVERAARGAGAPAGTDSDAGVAAAWLEARGLAVLEGLAERLARGPARIEPADDIDLGGASLAFHGALLVDLALARARTGPYRLVIRNARDPLFVPPHAARQAARGVAIALAWRGGAALFGAEARLSIGSGDGLVELAIEARPRHAAAFEGTVLDDAELERRRRTSVMTGVAVDEAAWRELGALAARTYVPASARSRSRGAGAEVDDST